MRVCPYCHLLLADNESVCPHDATQTAPAEPSPVPAALQSKYRDLQPFAQGQTGALQLGLQAQSAFKGLLKVIPLARFEGSERVRLKRELRKQTKLAHDGLPRIVDGGELPQELWLFREFVAGESLAQRIRRRGRLEVDEALLITAQVASALDELQRNGLLHRDVKPGHVILESGPKNMPISKLIDAGVAARLPGESVFDLVGTPAYISPEQVAGKLVSFRSDLYALGCMLFEMLTGKPPFPGDDIKAVLEAHKSAKVPDPDAVLPAPALALLRALLAKEPRQRPFSAQQVRRTLEPLLPPGAPLPVLQSRAPSSAGGISAPPPAAGRGSSPGAAKPRSSVPPTPPAAARANRDRSGGIPTEEISLEEIELPPSQASGPSTILLQPDDLEEIDGRGPSTIRLGEDDIAALEVREEAAALSAAVAREPEELAYDTGQVAAITAATDARQTEPEPPPSSQPFHEPAPATVQENASPQAAEPAAASASGSAPGRRAVDFDVESLFDDDVPSEPAVRGAGELQDAAPTQIYRPRPDAPLPARAESPYVEPAADRPDPEGTVMVPRPGAKPARRPPWLWIGAGAGLLLLLVLVFAGGDDSEAPAAAAGDGAPAAEGDGKEPAGTVAPANPAAPAGQQADRAQARAPNEPAQPPAAAAQGAAAADEAPAVAVAPTPEQLAVMREGSEQEPGAAAAEVQPAVAAAAGERLRTGEPTLSAAAASAKLGPSAGSKLVAPRAPRADRVAKAEELRQQGRTHYQAARYREAAIAYQGATEQDPSDPRAFSGLAASRLAMGDANGAIAAYSRAVRLQPGSSGYHAALGKAYLASGDRNRAKAAYSKALQLNPNNGEAHKGLAQLR